LGSLRKITRTDDDKLAPATITSEAAERMGRSRQGVGSMKKTVITFGLMSGAVSAAMMLATVPFITDLAGAKGEIFGYSAIVLSFLLVFFGIRSYRENHGGGAITFGRGLSVGLLIVLISSACYVFTWEMVYYKWPGLSEKFETLLLDNARKSSPDPAKRDASVNQVQEFLTMYRKPLNNIAMTSLEPFPLGVGIALLSAAFLRRRA
jgi:hypothetical protein